MNSSLQLMRVLVLLPFSLLLAACGPSSNFSDLQSFVEEIKLRPGGEVDPVPVFAPYEGFNYGATSLRSPFQVPLVIDSDGSTPLAEDVEPDFERIREELESHLLSELTMVGMLTKRGVIEALIKDAFSVVHRVAIGDYMGRNYGRIRNITETQINMIEIVPSGNGGWVERPQILMLQ